MLEEIQFVTVRMPDGTNPKTERTRDMNRRKSSRTFQKEKVILTVSSLLVMAALTVTGVYIYNGSQIQEPEENVVDFSALEEAEPDAGIALAENQTAKNLTSGQPVDGELDYDPYYIEQERILNGGQKEENAQKPDREEDGSGKKDEKQTAPEPESAETETKAAEKQEQAHTEMTENVGYATVERSGQTQTTGQALPETERVESVLSEGQAADVSGNDAKLAAQDEPDGAQAMEAVANALAEENRLHFSEEDKLEWPIVGNVLLNYSMDKTIFFPTLRQYKYNPSIVIGSAQGTNVACAADGIVSQVYKDAQTGNTVVMNLGDGYELTYGQLDQVAVEVGDFVETGAFLGQVAAPTKYYTSEGTNVYFKLTKDGEPVNPLDYLG